MANGYAKLVSWEVTNFMSIEHGVCEFDGKNIINIKGYNDSGKSAMLTALDTLMTNFRPNKQVEFIQDGKEFFRVVAMFDDGITILRDKYINGQSLYEMYNGQDLIYTTKQGNALSRVPDVPEPIKEYLGLVTYEDTVLNSRKCFEKQLGVQTTGSENYKMFNTVLKSEELANASTLLNTDKNSTVNDIHNLETEIQANKNIVMSGSNLTDIIISFLKDHDAQLDTLIESETNLRTVDSLHTAIVNIPDMPMIDSVDTTQFSTLGVIQNSFDELNAITVAPKVDVIDTSNLSTLSTIQRLYSQLSEIVDAPNIQSVNVDQLSTLSNLVTIVQNIKTQDDSLVSIDAQLTELNAELITLEKTMSELGVKMVRCPECGKLFNPEEGHID